MRLNTLALKLFSALIVAYTLTSIYSFAQSELHAPEMYKGQRVYSFVDKMPDYPNLTSYLLKHLSYPDSCLEAGIDDGRLLFSFIVDTSGIVRDVKLLRGGCGKAHTDAIIKAIQNMGRWEAGILNGRRVPVRFKLPVQLCFMGR
jgi:hypothetical protein